MGYSMSTLRDSRLMSKRGEQVVTVWGYDRDGGDDGLPVAVARGQVHVLRDGPDAGITVTGPDGSVYSPTESDWSPTRSEWVIEAKKASPEDSGDRLRTDRKD